MLAISNDTNTSTNFAEESYLYSKEWENHVVYRTPQKSDPSGENDSFSRSESLHRRPSRKDTQIFRRSIASSELGTE